MEIYDELEMMKRLHSNPAFSLRLWVVGSPDRDTFANVDWIVADQHGKHPHAVKLARFTWNGQLDDPLRAILCAEEAIASAHDNVRALKRT